MARLWRSRYTLPLVAFFCAFSVVFFLSFSFYARPLRTLALNLDTDTKSTSQTAEVGLVSGETGNEPPPSGPAPRILLVSAFFPVSQSKHSVEEYLDWLQRFLGTVTTDLYFFCPPDLADMIRQFRGNLPITIDMTYTSPFNIPPLKDHAARYKDMHNWDREKWRHSPDLYAVWNAKPYLLDYATKQARAKKNIYDYAFWTDAGAMRDDNELGAWPDPMRVKEVFEMGSKETGQIKERLIFFPMWNFPDAKFKYWAEDMGPVDTDFSEGSFFGGGPVSITWFRRAFYTYHNHYLSKNKFVGKDQTIINALFLLFPSRFFGVSLFDTSQSPHEDVPWNADTPLGTCGNTWYYYEWWLAGKETRDEMAEMWLEQAKGSSKGWKDFWKASVRCREGAALGMEKLLKRVFGKGWMAPKRDVRIKYNV